MRATWSTALTVNNNNNSIYISIYLYMCVYIYIYIYIYTNRQKKRITLFSRSIKKNQDRCDVYIYCFTEINHFPMSLKFTKRHCHIDNALSIRLSERDMGSKLKITQSQSLQKVLLKSNHGTRHVLSSGCDHPFPQYMP